MIDAEGLKLQRILDRTELSAYLNIFARPGVGLGVLRADGQLFVSVGDWPPADAQMLARFRAESEPTTFENYRCYPLRAGAYFWGTLVTHGEAAERDHWDAALWRSLGTILDQALAKRSVASEALERYREISLLYRLAVTIGASLDAEAIPQMMLDECNRIIKADAGVVVLGDYWEVKAGSGDAHHRENLAKLARRILADETRHGQPSIITDEPGGAPAPGLNIYSALMWVPLKINEQVLGGFILARIKGQPVFTASDEKLLVALAGQASYAVENARLHRAALDKQRLERELQLAFDVQARLMPRHVPTIAGWEFAAWWQPAKEVSGDYYDFIIHEHHKVDDILSFLSEENSSRTFSKTRGHAPIGLVVADVSDKGMHAALYMALTRSTVRASTLAPMAPADSLSQANRLLCADSTGGMFVTLFYARLNPVTNEIIYVNGGHNPPFWYQAAQDRFVELKGNGIMLGFDETWQFEQISIQVEKGDFIALYTDGVTEAVNQRREQYGEARLMQVLQQSAGQPAEAVLQAVQKSLTEFMSNAPQFDDITFVVAKCLA
jgi:sigma-B regulation protein RsbU (phosphoserine phosphatase)